MTEEDRKAIAAANADDAARDICNYVADIILKRELTVEERAALSIKAKYWFGLAETKGRQTESTRQLVNILLANVLVKKPIGSIEGDG